MKTSSIFKVVKPGLQTTIQDVGRYGYQQYGISPSGAMDPYAMNLANILVGNSIQEAVIEACLIGPTLEALRDMTISVCGGRFSIKIDGKEAQMWKSFSLKKGQILSFGNCIEGARAYLAVAGGIDVPLVLGSKSTFLNGEFGGHEGRSLEKEDLLYGNPKMVKPSRYIDPALVSQYSKNISVRVILGPHQNRFKKESLAQFFEGDYTVTPQSNRMGYQLKGPKLEHVDGPDIISDPIPLGGIQVPASGQPIILLSERQTTGGYTRIGTVISVDIPLLAQAVPGTKIHFMESGLEEAQEVYLEQQRLIKHLSIAAK